MFHLAVYRGSVAAATNNTSLALIVGSSDVVNSNNQYFPPQPMNLIWACSFGTTIQQPRITTPTLREFSPHMIRPFNITTPLGSDFNFDDISDYPIRLSALEGIDVQASNSDAMNAQTATVMLGLKVRDDPIPKGLVRRRILLTGTTTAVANAWTTVPLTFADVLPSGWYGVVGMQAFGQTMYACRLSFPGMENNYRPGVPCNQTIGLKYPPNVYQMQWGMFGKFNQASLPVAEILCTAGDTAQTIYLDLVRLGNAT